MAECDHHVTEARKRGDELGEGRFGHGYWGWNARELRRMTESVAHYLFESLDLLGVAEAYSREEAAIGKQNRTNVNKRHKTTNKIKRRFINYNDKSDFKTTSDAAREFYENQLTEAERLKLCPSRQSGNAVRTLCNAVRNHKKT